MVCLPWGFDASEASFFGKFGLNETVSEQNFYNIFQTNDTFYFKYGEKWK